MSSPDKVSVSKAGFGPEGGERDGVRQAGPRAQGRPAPGPNPGAPRIGQGEGGGGFADPEGFESERVVLEAGGPVLWGREGRHGSSADDKGDDRDLADESAAAILQQLTDRDVLGARRYPSLVSSAAKESRLWAGPKAAPGGRGAAAQSCGEAQPAVAGPLPPDGAEGGRTWGTPKRGTKSRMKAAANRPRSFMEGLVGLPSDTESSDEFSELQPIRVSICLKEGGQVKPRSSKDPGDTARHSTLQVREHFLPSAPQGLTSVVERQDAGELEMSSPKKMQSMLWGKAGNRPYPGHAAAVSSLPQATPRRKGGKEKKSLQGISNLALGRIFPPWGQRVSAAPVEPATFPPITGIPLLGRSKRDSSVPSGTKQRKHSGTGKKSVTWKATVSEPAVAGEDKDPNRDPAAKGQLPTHRRGRSFSRRHRGESSRGNLNTRASQDPGSLEPLARNQGDDMPRGPAPPGDQEPLDQPPRPERQQQAPGAQGCPRCPVLQRKIDSLKEQLAAMENLAYKFQIL
ncbi:uncharacterized protein CXorf49 homolog [Vicugna pacos]|uniref:Uncharacterized protein CXorf49 homolog n=1 Tax=Vicugna pacos TaxID=30538 RepID=A0ABM5CVI6_VICPA